MRICKVWDSEYPWDVRAEKVASSLTRAGHDVHMVARNRDGRPLVERLPECTVHRMSRLPIGRTLNAKSMFPAWINPRWASLIHGTARRIDADIVLVRDLPLAPTAIWAARRLGVPVVLDMAENYPAMMREIWDSGVQGRFDWLVRNPAVVAGVERWSLRRVDHTIVVVEESGARLVEKLGVAADRITVVSNTPPLARLDVAIARPQPRSDGALSLVYLGLLEAARGIGTMIDAVALGVSRGIPLHLTLIGKGREEVAFRAQARERGLTDRHIRFTGFLPYHEALQIVATSQVGVVPHIAYESWNTTIPNKLFDYMAAGLPVLVSDAAPVARIVRETGSGMVFRSGDAAAVLNAAQQLGVASVRDACGARGRAAVREKYHWECDARRLVAAMEQVAFASHSAARDGGRSVAPAASLARS